MTTPRLPWAHDRDHADALLSRSGSGGTAVGGQASPGPPARATLGLGFRVVSTAMYVKTSVRKAKGGEVRYLQLTHNEWDGAARRSVPKIGYTFGHEGQLDTDAIRRPVAPLSRLLDSRPGYGESEAGAPVRLGTLATAALSEQRAELSPAGLQSARGRARNTSKIIEVAGNDHRVHGYAM